MRTICSILAILLLVSGCATTRYREDALAAGSEVDRKVCEEFAKAEVASIQGQSLRDFSYDLFRIAAISMGILVPVFVPLMLVENAQARGKAYEEALALCLKPIILERSLGPHHPSLAGSLATLARRYSNRARYAEAETLYKRALAIYEKTANPNGSEVASLLEEYAALFRSMGLEDEAEQLAARAKATVDNEAK